MANYWTTRDGRQIEMTEMTNKHLSNAIKFFKPDKKNSTSRWKLLTDEAKRRGWDIEEKNGEIESRFDILDIRKKEKER